MSRRSALAMAVGLFLLYAARAGLAPAIAARVASSPPMAALCADDAQAAVPAAPAPPRASRRARAEAAEEESVPPDWPGRDVLGGDIPPVRTIADPHPTFDGLAIDTDAGWVVMSDENRHGLLAYDHRSGDLSDNVTTPVRHLVGPETFIGFAAGVALDPARREMYTVNNDGGDKMLVFSYDDDGNAPPRRILNVPHQSWGISLSKTSDEMALSVQQLHGFVVYNRGAKGTEVPLRTVRGAKTGLADPHGIYFDGKNREIVVANHGNWTELRRYTAYDPLSSGSTTYTPGRFDAPSITVHAADATGDAAALRTISGRRTQLNWPMGLDVDTGHDEIAVANYGDSSVLVFSRTAQGDAAPVRVIRGAATGIVGLVSVAFDAKRNELWVANYGDHTALVFDRTASGNVEPKRIVRNAPARTPTCGFTNASAAAYDTKRGQILVPN
jgi:DNA-binding beta-propeller fold protein YncE